MKKIFILDTNTLISAPNIVFSLEDNDIVIPMAVMEELDNFKNEKSERGYFTREVVRNLEQLKQENDLIGGVRTPGGGHLWIDTTDVTTDKIDNQIIRLAGMFASKYTDPVILITNDLIMSEKAAARGILVSEYKNDTLSKDDDIYTGCGTLTLPQDILQTFFDKGFVNASEITSYLGEIDPFVENQYFILKSEMSSALGRYKDGIISAIKTDRRYPFALTPRNAKQFFLMDALLAPTDDIPCVILQGLAGCGKTFLSIAAGLDQTYYSGKNGIYRKLIISRTNCLADEELGALPGDLEAKLSPLLLPFFDNILNLLIKDGQSPQDAQMHIDDMLESGILELAAMAYARGRSITNSYIIIDEAQNTSVPQMRNLLTRAGEGSKLVILGDPTQVDNPKLSRYHNGLVFAAKKMKGSSLCAQIVFDKESECHRSALAADALKRFKTKEL